MDNNLNTHDNSYAETNVHLQRLQQFSNHTSICHLNTQSMCSTSDGFYVMCNTYKYDIITLSETWLKNNHHLVEHVQIPGYQIDYRNRDNMRDGGVGVYIKEHIKFKRRHDIEKIVDSFEHMWFEFSGKNKYSSFLLGILYQPHSDNASKELWLNHLEHLISNIMIKWDGVMILAGDTNIDLLKQPQVADKYMRILATFKLTKVITEPKRQGKTLIDHIATNIPKKVVASGVLPCPEISDHDAPYITANIRVTRFVPRYKYIQNEKSLNVKNFTLDFSRLPFKLVYAVSDPNDKLEIFNDLVQKCLNKDAPRTRTRVTRPPAPWMKDLNIRQLQEQRDLYRYKAYHSGLDSDWKIFRNVKNKIKKVIKDTKRVFYQSASSSKRPKEIWSTIHRILHPNPKPINEDPEKMNAHFSKLAEKLTGRESISCDVLTQIIDNMPSTNSVKFQLRKLYYNEVKKALSSIRKDCSSGHDNISIRLSQPVLEFKISALTHIINSCIQNNMFPAVWKTSRISPIPKVDNPSGYDDYRPIAILPVLSKVLENLVLQQMQEFIYSHRLLHDTQSGFRKGRSTTTALLKFKDDISKAMKKGEITLAVFADFSKAFNTVDPEVLINKLSKMNFSKSFLHLLISYLSDRE